MSEHSFGGTIGNYLRTWYEYEGEPAEEKARTPEAIFRDYIEKTTDNTVLSEFVYKEMLRSVITKFGNIHYVDGDNKLKRVKAMHGVPERVIGKLTKESNIILPVITVNLETSESDPDKRRTGSMVIQRKEWNDDIQRAERVISLADVPVKMTYSINVWSKYMEDLDQVTQNLRVKFNPSASLNTCFSENIKMFLDSETNFGSYQAADQEDRLLRKSFKAHVEMYLPSPRFKVTSTGEILRLNGEFWVS